MSFHLINLVSNNLLNFIDHEVKTKLHFFVYLYRLYDKITSKEIIFDMNQKAAQKFNKWIDNFAKIRVQHCLASKSIEHLFSHIEK